MDLRIAGRVALVLAAGGGLGRATCLSLAREGVRVAAIDINEKALGHTVQLVGSDGGQILPMLCDISDLSAMEVRVEEVVAQLGPIQMLVNITGGPPPTGASEVPSVEWNKHFDAMVTPIFHVSDLVLPGMRASGWGRIITSTSSGIIAPIPNLGISNSLRLALVGWSKTLAGEVAADGVTVNIVAPGRIATQRVRELDEARAKQEGMSPAEVAVRSAVTIPVGRYGKPEEYGDVVAFIASEQASYLNGSVIRVDGGMIPSI